MDATPQRHVGVDITAQGDSFYFDANGYIDGIPDFSAQIDALGPRYSLKPLAPQRNLPIIIDESRDASYPYAHVHLFQQIVGTLGWIALCHPGIASRHGELASYTHKPCETAFRVAKGVLDELKREGLDPLEITRIRNVEIRLWIDCAVRHHTGRRAWVLQLADASWSLTDRRNLVAWRTVQDRMKHASSTAGEVNAIMQALQDVEDIFFVGSALIGSANVRVLSDSMSGILQIANGGHTFKDRRRSDYIKELLNNLPFPHYGISHVSGLIQLADPLTKVKALNWFTHGSSVLP